MSDRPQRRLETTRWSLILAARVKDGSEAAAALSTLCELYWFPVYAFIRRTGVPADAASDLTQAFFVQVLEKDWFQQARQERGKFRTFLLTAVRHFLTNEYDAARAQKRGGGKPLLSLEFDDGERRYLREPSDGMTPEHVYERRWALTVLDAALNRLSKIYSSDERRPIFLALVPWLTGKEPESVATQAASLNMTETAFRVALHRLRKQFSKCLVDIVSDTVAEPREVDEELRSLLAAVARK